MAKIPAPAGTTCECRNIDVAHVNGKHDPKAPHHCRADATCLVTVWEGTTLNGTPMFGKRALCDPCAEWLKLKRKNLRRRERDQAMRDLGLKRVKGSLGGTYWE